MESNLESKLELYYLRKMEKEVPEGKQLDFMRDLNIERKKIYNASVSSIYEDAYQNTFDKYLRTLKEIESVQGLMIETLQEALENKKNYKIEVDKYDKK